MEFLQSVVMTFNNTTLQDTLGPSTPYEWNWHTGGALTLACVCALLANSAGVGGGPFYMPLFNSILGFNINASTALSHTVVAASAIASSVYGIIQRSPVDPDSSLIDFDLALTFVPALLVGTGIGVIFNTLLPSWLQTFGLVGLLGFVIYKTGKKGYVAWKSETRSKQEQAEHDEEQIKLYGEGKGAPDDLESTSHEVPQVQESAVRKGLRHLRQGKLAEMNHDAMDELDFIRHWVEVHGGSEGMWKRTRAALIPLLKIIALWVVFLALKLGMSRSSKCSVAYFGFWAAQTLFCAAVTALVVILHVRQLKQDKESMDPNMRQLLLGKGDERSTRQGISKLLQAVAIMVVAGATAGLLGIGGALIFNPFLLAMGVHPQVTASTAVLMILFSSSNISLSFHFQGMLNTSYAAVFAPTCFVASLLGVTMIGRIVKQTGRASIIIIILTGLITVGAVLTAILGGIRSYNDIKSGEGAGFKPLCS